jgi:FkbM family methyltransferase
MNERAVFKTLTGVELTGEFRPGKNDRDCLTSCICEDPYWYYRVFEDEETEGLIAIDLGAHIGGPTLALASLGFKVLSVEALLENRALLQTNVLLNEFEDQVEIIPYAIGNKDHETVTATYGDIATQSGKVHEFMGNTTERTPESISKQRQVRVETISLGTILEGIEACAFIKSDCENSEWSAFRGLSHEQIDKLDWISLELHSGTIAEFLEMLHNRFEDLTSEFQKDKMDFGHYLLRRIQ